MEFASQISFHGFPLRFNSHVPKIPYVITLYEYLYQNSAMTANLPEKIKQDPVYKQVTLQTN